MSTLTPPICREKIKFFYNPLRIVDMRYPNISMKYVKKLYGYGIDHEEKFAWIGVGIL